MTSHGLEAGLLIIHLQHLADVVIHTVGRVVLTVDLRVHMQNLGQLSFELETNLHKV